MGSCGDCPISTGPSTNVPPSWPPVNIGDGERLPGSAASGPWHRLAGRAEVRRAVHEGDPADRGAAARAGLVLLAVGVQRPVEVAALAVDVDVERVERRAALAEGL